MNKYFLLAQCPWVASACGGAQISPDDGGWPLVNNGAIGQRYTAYTAAAAGRAFQVWTDANIAGTACTYVVAAKGAFPTIRFLRNDNDILGTNYPSLYI